jgi:hypothetical protein
MYLDQQLNKRNGAQFREQAKQSFTARAQNTNQQARWRD